MIPISLSMILFPNWKFTRSFLHHMKYSIRFDLCRPPRARPTFIPNYCTSPATNILQKSSLLFETMIESRREEARKSVLIEVLTKNKEQTLQSVCSSFGNIKSMFEFTLTNSKKFMYIIEFEEESSLNKIIEAAQANSNKESENNWLPFLRFLDLKIYSVHSKPNNPPVPVTKLKTNFLDKETMIQEILFHMLYNCFTMSEQIQFYYDQQKMTEIGCRLRFLTCRKIECVLPRVLSHLKVLPFGSSVNTFGNNFCDLDMVIDFSGPSQKEKYKDFPLIIQPCNDNVDRSHIKKNLDIIADLMRLYMPGFSSIVKILHARVPIIKCNENFTGMECDITAFNKSGYYMSELLYIYGSCDPRVSPLVFSVRWWAKEKKLYRKMQPGRWFSNFTITLLVLFFLINTKIAPVIPSMSRLKKLSDNAFTIQGITYNFVRDASVIPASSNTQSLEELLIGFFSFYKSFDFKTKGLSIITGKTFIKPNFSALYIENPIENELNVSKNITLEELEAFKIECVIALEKLREKRGKPKWIRNPWGLISIIRSDSEVRNLRVNIKSLLTNTDSGSEDIRNADENMSKNEMVDKSENVDENTNWENKFKRNSRALKPHAND